MEKGYIQVYTGNGKGKTTAALGISLRAICAGNKVFIGQFIKGMEYSEQKATEMLPNFTMEQLGRGCFIYVEPADEDIKVAKEGLEKMRQILAKGEHDVVIFDEVNVALYYKLFTVEELIDVLDSKADHVEVICTGRYAPQELIDKADLVTEMKEIKHYYNQGVQARIGVEK